MILATRMGGKILWCGNGGSAADAQHMAAEFMVRFRHDRRGIPSVALSTDTSILTAASNDYGYEHIFQRQVEALAVKGDVVVGISTSGNSRNVFLALEAARKIGAVTVAFTGKGGGKLATWADFLFAVPSSDTARIQEAHILGGHVLCEILELERMQPATARAETSAWATKSDIFRRVVFENPDFGIGDSIFCLLSLARVFR